jgi:hypothetical protein
MRTKKNKDVPRIRKDLYLKFEILAICLTSNEKRNKALSHFSFCHLSIGITSETYIYAFSAFLIATVQFTSNFFYSS